MRTLLGIDAQGAAQAALRRPPVEASAPRAHGALVPRSLATGPARAVQRSTRRLAPMSSSPSNGRPASQRRLMPSHASLDDVEAVAGPSGSSAGSDKVLTLPTILTLGRVAAVPAIVLFWFLPAEWAPTACACVFVGASVTDYLDGYLARKLNASSAFGAFLDPVADKLMVCAVLILLSTAPIAAGPLAGNAWIIPSATLAIVSREITVSALREWAATQGSQARGAVAVNWVGKWKTALQMAALTLLLILRMDVGGALGSLAAWAGPTLLLAAAVLTAWSLVVYMGAMMKHM